MNTPNIRITCSKCGTTRDVSPSLAGLTTKCIKCWAEVFVPNTDTTDQHIDEAPLSSLPATKRAERIIPSRNISSTQAQDDRTATLGVVDLGGRVVDMINAPLILMNYLSGIVGGIWLAIYREWRLIFIGIALLVVSHVFIASLLLPARLLASFGMYLYKRKNPLFYLSGFLSHFYTNLLIVGTCAIAFFLCAHFYSGNSIIELIPYLLWSWSIALGDWQYFASKDQHNGFSILAVFSASIFYFLFLVSIFVSPLMTLIIIALFMLVQLLVIPMVTICSVPRAT